MKNTFKKKSSWLVRSYLDVLTKSESLTRGNREGCCRECEHCPMSPGYWAKCEGFWHPRRSLGPWNRCPSTLRWHFLAGQWNWSRDRSRMSRTGQHWRCTKIQVPARKRGHICNRQSCSTGSHFLARQIVKLEWARFVLPPQQHQLPPRRRRTRYEETWPWMSGTNQLAESTILQSPNAASKPVS